MIRVLYRKQDFPLLFGSVGQNECLEGKHVMLLSLQTLFILLITEVCFGKRTGFTEQLKIKSFLYSCLDSLFNVLCIQHH